jgi:hypothetical protein
MSNERAAVKTLNRTALTKALVAHLKHDEAVIGGIGNSFDDGGPVLLAVKIDDQPGKVQTVRDQALVQSRFMKGLGTGRGGALDA